MNLRNNIKLKIASSLAFGLLLTVVVQFFSHNSIKKLVRTNAMVSHTYQVINETEKINSQIAIVEGSVRGYAISGKRIFLETFSSDTSELFKVIARVRELTEDNPQQQERASRISPLATEKVDFNKAIINARDLHGPDSAEALIASGKGKRITDQIFAITNEIIKEEEASLKLHTLESETFAVRANNIGLLGGVIAVLVVLLAIFFIFRDINERNRMQAELKKAKEDAEQSSQAKELFLANMSHEIRTPMNAILGFTHLLQKTDLDEEQQEYVEAVRSSGGNLLSIINDILDLSKIEAGMMHIEKVPFSMHSLLESVKVLLQYKAIDKSISLSFHEKEKVPALLLGDPVRLTQMLINLIGNAIKFTEQGGVTVTVGIVREDASEVSIKFIIEDTGIGIPKDKLESIFERFNQATTDTTRKFGGTGLGLSIVKKLVELQHGELLVNSEPGKGSAFTLVLPFKKASEEQKLTFTEELSESKLDPGVSLNILIAEDNILNQKLAIKVLSRMGFNTQVVSNGKEAVEAIKNNKGHYDVILMDMQMPEMDGYEAARIIRHEMNIDIPIIAMTAHAMTGEKEKCLSLGMNDYISKPYKSSELFNKISKLVNTGKAKAARASKPGQAGSTLFDTSRLMESADGDIDFARELVKTFLETEPPDFSLLENAVHRKDVTAIRHLAHKMRSSTGMVGLTEMTELLKAMEMKCMEGADADEITNMFTGIKQLQDRAVPMLEAFIDQPDKV